MSLILWATLGCITDEVGKGLDSGTSLTTTDTTDPTGSDDSGPTDPTGTGTETGDNESALVGDWLSEGSNIAPLLANFYVKVVGHFDNDGTYSVVATRENANVDTLEGTYVVDLSTTPQGIVLQQTLPYEATAEGIWLVTGDTLQYEIVQTEPNPYNYVPPTPESGFGSSSGGTLAPGDNVQIFVRQ